MIKAMTSTHKMILIGIAVAGLILAGLSISANSTRKSETTAVAGPNSLPRAAIPPIDAAAPTQTETATFALGWFWGPDSRFGSIPGVVRTRVGYAGGTTENPTYHNLGDHSETIQIDYDPTQISYRELLDVFWDSHNPAGRSPSRQYMSIVFYHNDEQRRLALETRDREAARVKGQITTEIVPFSRFYLAEDYHQKYWLRQKPEFMQEFDAIYPNSDDLIASTAAARVNGYVAGHGSLETLQAEVDHLGLSPEARQKLLEIVHKSSRKESTTPWLALD
jgi:peptide-methionine (S)-S-oxide reductase